MPSIIREHDGATFITPDYRGKMSNLRLSGGVSNTSKNRHRRGSIYQLQKIRTNMVDGINRVLHRNSISLQPILTYSQYKEITFTLTLLGK